MQMAHMTFKRKSFTARSNALLNTSIARKNWKKGCGYHKRSLTEPAMYRIKIFFGGILKYRTFKS